MGKVGNAALMGLQSGSLHGRREMTSILRSPQALQLTLALIKPDAVAHPLILDVRTSPKPLLCALGTASVSGAGAPLVKTDNTVLC